MCSFTKKASASGGLPDPQSSFMSPNNPLGSTPLLESFFFYSSHTTNRVDCASSSVNISLLPSCKSIYRSEKVGGLAQW